MIMRRRTAEAPRKAWRRKSKRIGVAAQDGRLPAPTPETHPARQYVRDAVGGSAGRRRLCARRRGHAGLSTSTAAEVW